MSSFYINVTQEHVKAGFKNSFTNCPVSLAFRDIYKCKWVIVNSSGNVTVNPITGPLLDLLLSKSLTKKIKIYDQTGKMKAGKYLVTEVA